MKMSKVMDRTVFWQEALIPFVSVKLIQRVSVKLFALQYIEPFLATGEAQHALLS